MGEVTNIQHLITSAVGQYPRGDLVFDVGTVIYGVDKGWPMTVIDTDRNDFLARFGVPRRHFDDGYHAYLALHNHESTVGHYVRVVDESAKYSYLACHSFDKPEQWSEETTYAIDYRVLRKGVVYKSTTNGNEGNAPDNGSDWEEAFWTNSATYETGELTEHEGLKYVSRKEGNIDSEPGKIYWELYKNYKGDWAAGTYSQGDAVTYDDSGTVKLFVCAVETNSEPPDTNWTEDTNFKNDYSDSTTYSQDQIVKAIDGELYVSQEGSHTGNDPVNPSWTRWLDPGAVSFDTAVSVGGDNFMTAWLKNGATADNACGIGISGLNDARETFQVTVYEKINGEAKAAEGPFTVGLTPGSTKADGSPLFIEAVFEQYSQIVGFEVDEEGAEFGMIAEEPVCWFTGGNPGGEPTDADYQKAWDLLKKAEVDQLFMAGDTNTEHIKYALATADDKQIRLEADTIGGTPEAVAQWVDDNMGILQSHLLSATYGRVSFKDSFYRGSRKTLGMSGFATAAKAYGREKSKTMIDAGIEEVPAGEDFGLLRGVAGIRNETPLSEEDQKVLAKSWVNYILNSTRAGIIFWEQFTCYGEESPLAYKRIVDVMNYVYKIHREIMRDNQFRGKSDYEIIEMLSPPLERLKTKGVLVPDATGESEFSEPFRIWITTPPNSNKRQIHRMMRVSRAIGPIVLETILA